MPYSRLNMLLMGSRSCCYGGCWCCCSCCCSTCTTKQQTGKASTCHTTGPSARVGASPRGCRVRKSSCWEPAESLLRFWLLVETLTVKSGIALWPLSESESSTIMLKTLTHEFSALDSGVTTLPSTATAMSSFFSTEFFDFVIVLLRIFFPNLRLRKPSRW